MLFIEWEVLELKNINNNLIINYKETNNILKDSINIIDSSKEVALRTVNVALVQRNWLLGKRIATEELKDSRKENYGKEIIKKLSCKLTKEYGSGFNKTNLYNFYLFYKMFPNIFHSMSGKSFRLLSWTHYRTLLQVEDKDERFWYENEARNENWSVKTLQRNISTQYYQRMLLTYNKELVKNEMLDKTSSYDTEKLEFIKSPVIAEFLGYKNNYSYTETELEQRIINHIEEFMLELGKGYAYVGRQVRIETEKRDYYIDLVFYNYKLKCFVLIDIKTSAITYQDTGQMQMYVNIFDEFRKEVSDNPTIGIILCSDTDEDIAKYVLKGSNQVYMSKYELLLPSKEELKREIEMQKALYYERELI